MGDLPDACHALRLDLIEAADIRGALTRLRPARPEETHMVYEWAVDPAVAPYWGGFDLYPDFDAFTADWGPHYFDGTDVARGRVLMIETLPHEGAATGIPIGMIALNETCEHDRSVEIDMLIGPADYRGRGYGTDALQALLRFVFKEVGLHRVWLGTYAHNARARRAYEKAGFTLEGMMRESDRVDGIWVDCAIYGVLENEITGG